MPPSDLKLAAEQHVIRAAKDAFLWSHRGYPEAKGRGSEGLRTGDCVEFAYILAVYFRENPKECEEPALRALPLWDLVKALRCATLRLYRAGRMRRRTVTFNLMTVKHKITKRYVHWYTPLSLLDAMAEAALDPVERFRREEAGRRPAPPRTPPWVQ